MSTGVVYDPLNPAVLKNPYPVYARMRDEAPVFWHEGMGSWVLTRYDDCRAVLRDSELFARDRRRVGDDVPDPSLSVQSLDPPDQAPVRTLFAGALRAQDLEGIGLRARRTVEGFCDRATSGSEFELLGELAAPLSLQVISEMLGIMQPELESFVEVSDAIMRSMDAGLAPETAEPGRVARAKLSDLVESWFETSPAEACGLLSDVMQGADGLSVSEVWVRNTARVMFQGGYSTLTASIGNVVYTLLCHPEACDQLRQEPELLTSGVDELVRFDGPVQGTSRVATRSTSVGETIVKAGETVVVLFAAANHDPGVFDQPDRLILDRSPNPHFGFGWGTHSCIGTILAGIVLRELVDVFVASPNQLRLAEPPVHRRTATMRSLDALPVIFRRPRSPGTRNMSELAGQ